MIRCVVATNLHLHAQVGSTASLCQHIAQLDNCGRSSPFLHVVAWWPRGSGALFGHGGQGDLVHVVVWWPRGSGALFGHGGQGDLVA